QHPTHLLPPFRSGLTRSTENIHGIQIVRDLSVRDSGNHSDSVAIFRPPMSERAFQRTAADKHRAPGDLEPIEDLSQKVRAFFRHKPPQVSDDQWRRIIPTEMVPRMPPGLRVRLKIIGVDSQADQPPCPCRVMGQW